ncbi:MAG: exonuclease SbcCD subunit D [Nitriliruptoraceae bacterium]
MRFLHTSDWQLGMTRHFLSGEAQVRFDQARLDVIARMADLAQQRGCRFVVVAGDVFETNQPEERTVARALDQLARFTVPVYLLPGNHDPYDHASILRNPRFVERCPANVEVLSDGEPRRPTPDIEVVGAPWRSKRPAADLVSEVCWSLEPTGPGDPRRVVVGHGSVGAVSGSFDAPGGVDLDRVERALDDGRVHYVALGDRHSFTPVGSSGRVWFCGAPEPTDYTEDDPGTCAVVDLSRDPPHVERVAVGTWSFHRLVQAVDGPGDLDELEARLDAIEDPARAIVKVTLEGTLDLGQVARLDQLLEDRALTFAAIEHPQRHRDVVVRPSEEDLASLPLSGYAAQARDRLLEQARADDDRAAVATDALGLLVRLVGEGERR